VHHLTQREVARSGQTSVEFAVLVEQPAGSSLEIGVVRRQQVRQCGLRKFVGGHAEAVCFSLETFGLSGWQLKSQLHDLHFTPSLAV
jgi:hypothetical protein